MGDLNVLKIKCAITVRFWWFDANAYSRKCVPHMLRERRKMQSILSVLEHVARVRNWNHQQPSMVLLIHSRIIFYGFIDSILYRVLIRCAKFE